MSDDEKTAVLIERLLGGKWPHKFVVFGMCIACGSEVDGNTPCDVFDPFDSIEDAFLCMEHLNLPMQLFYSGGPAAALRIWNAEFITGSKNGEDVTTVASDGASPARAITEAAFLSVRL